MDTREHEMGMALGERRRVLRELELLIRDLELLASDVDQRLTAVCRAEDRRSVRATSGEHRGRRRSGRGPHAGPGSGP